MQGGLADEAGWRPLLRSRLLTVLGLVVISSAAHVAVDARHERCLS